MAGNMRLFFVVSFILLSRVTDAQLYRCQLSRLDRFPCRFQFTNTFPGPNKYGIYRTNIRLGGAGVPECRVRNPLRTDRMNEVILPISNLGTDNLRLIFSPGMQFHEPYANQILVNYSIQCPTGTLAFFNVTRLDLQEKCANECVDYLFVHRGQFGVTESCGSDSTNNAMQLEFGEFSVMFRTSEEGRFPGFEAYTVCFDLHERDMPGCVNVNSTGGGRSKRDLEEYLRGFEKCSMSQFLIAHGDIVTYSQDTITIIRDGEVYQRIRSVLVLITIDGNGNRNTFFNEATDTNGIEIQFFGSGPLGVNDCFAIFQFFVINPRGILPTEAEGVIISRLAAALTATLGPQDDVNITRPEPPTSYLGGPGLRKKRQQVDENHYGGLRTKRETQVAEMPRFIEEDAIRDAIRYENACNPVLRTISSITIDVAERSNSTLVNQIREELTRG